ncbi:hypothetical protein GYH30_057302 [Glycine max]|nr:hypothetical protein GYH30_057302 [Glycine max]
MRGRLDLEEILNQPEDTGEKGVIDDDVDVGRNKDELGKTIGREQEKPPKSQIGCENGSKFSNWPNEREVRWKGFGESHELIWKM